MQEHYDEEAESKLAEKCKEMFDRQEDVHKSLADVMLTDHK